jgi:hypothetical protein
MSNGQQWGVGATIIGTVAGAAGVVVALMLHLDGRTYDSIREVSSGVNALSHQLDDIKDSSRDSVAGVNNRMFTLEGKFEMLPDAVVAQAEREAVSQNADLRVALTELRSKMQDGESRVSTLEETVLNGDTYRAHSRNSYEVFLRETPQSVSTLQAAAEDYFQSQGERQPVGAGLRTLQVGGETFGCVESQIAGAGEKTVAFCAVRQHAMAQSQ